MGVGVWCVRACVFILLKFAFLDVFFVYVVFCIAFFDGQCCIPPQLIEQATRNHIITSFEDQLEIQIE